VDQSDKDLACSRNLLHQSSGAAGKKGFIALSTILATSNSNFNPVIQSFGNVVAIEFHELMWLLIKVWDANSNMTSRPIGTFASYSCGSGSDLGPDFR
jgi:hypothetical protein